ncbi:MAG: hypothetical protein COT88_00945 [Candidatus Colwellbacteria bacterium CG10_big_fil_rev_8_21_14_0_10_41_28]|uniref:L,D-TPase catalytic domain-containing protein n=1 Tax=Candidatus Colwellbacteria bacterium CG10_big_fil_rev_8_21_14_0_10_41_28 TaxID=1974539 RepID=A0A2H0VHL3_9BACT|nr:MAG: hypothetical protein COT88_00945 [Candidatus Colwellbacteria bacterium CG10_big_fil_rev_8_21_14_0_10_41_28]
MSDIEVYSDGIVIFDGKKYKAAIGRSGVTNNKAEGDGGSPAGCFPIRKIFFRKDKISVPETSFVIEAIGDDMGWSDDPEREEYNTLIKLPYEGSHEKLWREDDLYDLIVVLGYNDDPPISGKGSAIFMHVARPVYTPTEGCVALSLENLKEILEKAGRDTRVCIRE